MRIEELRSGTKKPALIWNVLSQMEEKGSALSPAYAAENASNKAGQMSLCLYFKPDIRLIEELAKTEHTRKAQWCQVVTFGPKKARHKAGLLVSW